MAIEHEAKGYALNEPFGGAVLGVAGTGVVVAGRYRLSGRIGRGASADVYGARDEVLARPVAVKLFRFDTAVGEDRRRIDSEVRLLASLHHPGLVTVHDAGTLGREGQEGSPYLVMELINGPTLSQRLAEGPLSAADAAGLGLEAAATLAYIHAAGVVHRDIKPANILLDAPSAAGSAFSVKLTDFGIARMLDSTRLTMDGLTIGTANYLSPEQAEGRETGPPADVYALGLVLIQCLTGELAFPGVGVEAALARLHRPPDIPQHHGSGWAAILSEMTVRDPSQRPPAAGLVRRFSDLRQGPTPQVSGPVAATSGEAHHPSDTQLLPALAATQGGGRPGWIRYAAGVGLLMLVLVAAGLALILHTSNGRPGTAVTPGPYPSVSGQLGRDLHQLQGTVG